MFNWIRKFFDKEERGFEDFLLQYSEFFKGNIDKPSWLDDELGLCSNLNAYNHYYRYAEVEISLKEELISRFLEQGLSPSYPFGFKSYQLLSNLKRQSTCPQRQAWVLKTLEEVKLQRLIHG